ncbi:hypothetical protein HBA55_02405 [Pseudomaricurvus alkylphenolicus]|uniref:hypothetical protein n=1 Tax=Pseudomaricurvus alkylphenolicus TaxID=1306991 RepID=UPI00142292CA|nr:hypothetical protein [Pseudomaricurvus alkylphenolicus]NIB38416.1 hypothetical protein [Pseudomaricurvus alkylphenolicus]
MDLVHIFNIRKPFPDLKHRLETEYGGLNALGNGDISTDTLDYFSKAGVALHRFPMKISFISPRIKTRYQKYLNSLTPNRVRSDLTKEQWLQDLRQLDSFIRNDHVNPFWSRGESGYRSLVDEVEDYIESTGAVDPHVVNSYFNALVAYINDGHSYIVNNRERFGFYSFGVEWFENGLFLTRVDEQYEHLLGAKITAFDAMPVAEAARRMARQIPAVNESGYRNHSRFVYHYAGLLKAVGIAESDKQVTLSLILSDGERTSHRFQKEQRSIGEVNFKTLQDLKGPKPLYLLNSGKSRWFEYLDKDKTLYVYYGSALERTKGEIATFSGQVLQAIDEFYPQKLIVDVRNNGGGNSHLNALLINGIAERKSINQRGKLFVITGRNTFSAAINFSGNMEIKTRTLFAGEKVGDRASFAGEAGPQAKYLLPNSRTIVSLSFSEWISTYDNDGRDAIALDIPVTTAMQDILEGRDPVLEAVLAYKTTPQSGITLSETAAHGWIGRYDFSPDKALKIYLADGQLQMEVTETVFSSLYPVDDREVLTDMSGVKLRLREDKMLEWHQLGSPIRVLKPLSEQQQKPLELLVNGHFEQAKNAYLNIYKQQPDLLSIRGNSLGLLASHLSARYGNTKFSYQLREIAEAMHGQFIYSWLQR